MSAAIAFDATGNEDNAAAIAVAAKSKDVDEVVEVVHVCRYNREQHTK
tara:strand:+ start:923 stop:1066 length:144 start_codon:yes stop_codon:yes gene_type:complete